MSQRWVNGALQQQLVATFAKNAGFCPKSEAKTHFWRKARMQTVARHGGWLLLFPLLGAQTPAKSI